MKAVFLDYDTVSHGDLDTSALSAAAGELELCDSDDARIAARMHDADIVLLNKAELSRELLTFCRRNRRVKANRCSSPAYRT
jgi:hypothetical protein